MKWSSSASGLGRLLPLLVLALTWPAELGAQWTDLGTRWAETGDLWIDASSPRRGELRIGLGWQVSEMEGRFTADGTKQPLADVFSVLLDTALVPELSDLDTTLVSLFSSLGLPSPQSSSLGLNKYDVLIEKQRFPISLTFGFTDWLAGYVGIPVMKNKSFVQLRLDSTSTAGLSSTAFGENPDAFFGQLDVQISALEAIIALDTLSAELRALAEELVADARIMESGLLTMRDLQYAATDTGSNGVEISGFYDGLNIGFETFDLQLPVLTLSSLPEAELVSDLSSGPEFGIDPLEGRDTGIKFGDIEAGISLQPINTFRRRAGESVAKVSIRARLDGLYRFPTGNPPAANRVTDPGLGDGQGDLEFRSTFDLAYGSRFWLSLFAGYNIQFQQELERLITSNESPIQLGAFVAAVTWDPGDVLTLAAVPRFNLTRFISFSGSFTLMRHGRDEYEFFGANPSPDSPFSTDDIEEGSEYTLSWLGLSARYSTTAWGSARRRGLPAEVQLGYRTATSGSRGFAPDIGVWDVSLRLYPRPFR